MRNTENKKRKINHTIKAIIGKVSMNDENFLLINVFTNGVKLNRLKSNKRN